MTPLTTAVLLVGAALAAGAAWLIEDRIRQRGERSLVPVSVDRETAPRRRS
jgi:hypothetical protein